MAKVEDNATVQSLESLIVPPAIIKLVSTGLDAVGGAEAQMSLAGFQTGTGAQKLQIAAAVFTSSYAQYVQENAGPNQPPAESAAMAANIVQITNLLAQVFNLIPPAKATPTPIAAVVQPPAAPAPAPSPAPAPAAAAPAPAETAAAPAPAPAPAPGPALVPASSSTDPGADAATIDAAIARVTAQLAQQNPGSGPGATGVSSTGAAV